MGVLVVDDVGLVAGVAGDERVLVRERRAGLVEQVHLHPRRDAVRRGRHVRVVDVVAVGQAGTSRVRAVERVALDRVAVDGLEVAGRPGEADRVARRGGRGSLPRNENIWTAFWYWLVCHENGTSGSHEQRNAGHAVRRVEGVNGYFERLLAARRDLLARVGGVVVVQVQVHVGDVAGQAAGSCSAASLVWSG